MSDLIRRADAIDALGEEPPVWYDGEDEIAERNQWRRDKAAIKSLPSAEPKTEWIPVSDIRKLQDILYLHIDSLEGTRNIVEAGMLSAWKEVVEYLDGMLGEDGEA